MIKEIGGEGLTTRTGPGPDSRGTRPERPLPEKAVTFYTLGILWDELTPSVLSTIMRDCVQLGRVCLVNRSNLRIASSSSKLDGYLKFLDVKRTTDLSAATYWRVYVHKEVAEIPDHAELSDVIQVTQPKARPQNLVNDPTFPEVVKYMDIQRISDTIPLYRSPPYGKPDWNQQDIFAY